MSKRNIDLEGALVVAYDTASKKNKLVRLRSSNESDDFLGVVQNNYTDTPEQEAFYVEKSAILAVLNEGLTEDKPSTVLGVKIESYAGRVNAKKAKVVLYRKISESERKRVESAIANVVKIFRKNNLGYLFPITVELKRNSGKMQGYCRMKKGEESFVIGLTPAMFSGDGDQSIEHILSHELSHPLWQYYLSEDQKAKWISLYTSFSIVKEITPESLASMCKDLKGEGSIKNYLSNCDDDDKVLFKQALKWIRQNYRVDNKAIDLLMDIGTDISKFWPPSPLHLSSMDNPVSVYAAKSPVEFFCEAMANYLRGSDLSEKIKKRCRITLKSLNKGE